MKVRTEATVQGGRSIAVELNEYDGAAAFPEWDQMSVNDRFRRLSAKADMLAVAYLARENAITPEYARQRLSALREAMA